MGNYDHEVGAMVKFMVKDIDFDLRVEEFFDTYFFFEEAVKLSEWVDEQDVVLIMTEEGFDELLDCIDAMETKIAELMAEIKQYFAERK